VVVDDWKGGDFFFGIADFCRFHSFVQTFSWSGGSSFELPFGFFWHLSWFFFLGFSQQRCEGVGVKRRSWQSYIYPVHNLGMGIH